MDEPAKTTNELPVKHASQGSFISWIKRLGFAGVIFFLVKGLLWILIPVLVAKGCF